MSFPYRFCYDCRYLVFSKDQSRNLLPNFDEVICYASVCASEQGCPLCCREIGQSLAARYIKYHDDPSRQSAIYGILK